MSFQDITEAPCKHWCDLWINELHTIVPVAGNTGPTGNSFTGPTGDSFTGPTGASSSVTGPTGRSFTGPTGSSFTGPTGGSISITVGAPIAATDNNVLTLSGGVLSAEYATATRPGVISNTTQSILGDKTIIGAITANGVTSTGVVTATTSAVTPTLVLPASASIGVGTIQQPAGTRMFHTTGASNSTFLGQGAGNLTNTSSSNTGVGFASLQVVAASGNSAFGSNSGAGLTTGTNNVLIGSSSGSSASTAANNVIIGQGAGTAATSLSDSVIIGRFAGSGCVSQSGVILIGNSSLPTPPSNSINIGTTSTSYCQIRGIANITPASPTQMIVVDPTTHQLGSVTYLNDITNFTPTIDSGTITTSTMRGNPSTTTPVQLTKYGKMVTMVLPSFVVTAQSAAAGTLTLTGVSSLAAAYLPAYTTRYSVSMYNNSIFVTGTLSVNAGGIVNLQMGGAFTVPYGFLYDCSVSWNTLT